MYDRIGCHLSEQEVKYMTVLLGCHIEPSVQSKIKNAKDLFLALSKEGYCDESNFYGIIKSLKQIHRYDLIHMVQQRQKAKGNI